MSVRFSSDDLLNRAGIVHAAIMRGEVIAYPTETFYGLGADPANAAAIERIYAIKGRRAGEALPLIAADFDALRELGAEPPPLARRLAETFWPGALTLVLPIAPIAAGRFPDALTAGGSTVAVRVPDHPVARAIAAIAGGLITSTSANRSGHPPASTADDVHAALGDDDRRADRRRHYSGWGAGRRAVDDRRCHLGDATPRSRGRCGVGARARIPEAMSVRGEIPVRLRLGSRAPVPDLSVPRWSGS